MCIVMNAFPVPSLVTPSSFAVSVPSSPIAPISVPFPHKVFLWSIHWVQSPHQLVFNFLASIPVPSCSASYFIRDALVYIYMFLLASFFSPSLEYSQHFLSSPSCVSVSPFFSLLSVPLFLFSFPLCRAHNCIIERLLSQLTLSPSVSILSHS